MWKLPWKNPPRRIRRRKADGFGIHSKLKTTERCSWRAVCAERCKHGSEGDRWKRTLFSCSGTSGQGTSLAVYPTQKPPACSRGESSQTYQETHHRGLPMQRSTEVRLYSPE